MPATRIQNIIPVARTGRPSGLSYSTPISISAGNPIGLLLAITYSASVTVFKDTGPGIRIFNTSPRSRIKSN